MNNAIWYRVNKHFTIRKIKNPAIFDRVVAEEAIRVVTYCRLP